MHAHVSSSRRQLRTRRTVGVRALTDYRGKHVAVATAYIVWDTLRRNVQSSECCARRGGSSANAQLKNWQLEAIQLSGLLPAL